MAAGTSVGSETALGAAAYMHAHMRDAFLSIGH